MDDPVALRAPSARLDACRRTLDHAACGLNHPAPLVALDDVGAAQSALRADSKRGSSGAFSTATYQV
jgi:hypothetical protein